MTLAPLQFQGLHGDALNPAFADSPPFHRSPLRNTILLRATTLFFALPLVASATVIRVHSRAQGRTFLVDTDRPEIRKALREVGGSPKAVKPVLPANARLEAVWYDDEKGILRLRDPARRKEYDLDIPRIFRYATKSHALEASARADFPAWLAIYPAAKVLFAGGPPPGWRPQKFPDMRSYRIEMETPASVAEVAAFYRATMIGNGLSIDGETKSQVWYYSLQARTPDRMHRVTLNVLERAKDTHIDLIDNYMAPQPLRPR